MVRSPTASALLGLFCALMASGLAFAAGLAPPACLVAGVTLLCAVWWTLEPIPIPVTSLVPFAVLPMAGLLDREQAAAAFGHPLILLLLGGFLLSALMESSGAHERLALGIVRGLGAPRGDRMVFAFMAACAALSMWISNTATTLMLLPVASAVVSRSSAPERLSGPLFMGLAWSASIGGLGTPVGSPPNLLVLSELERQGTPWSFAAWMGLGVPVVLVLVPVAAWWACRGRRLAEVRVEVPVRTAWRRSEGLALGVFAVTALLWVTRTAPFGGWSGALGWSQVGDHTVALAAVVLTFLLPNGEGGRLLTWETASRVPWGLLLLFAGGLALGGAFKTSGLDAVLAGALSGLGVLPLALTVLLVALFVTFLTEVTSNTATAALLMPVLSVAAGAAGDEASAWVVPAGLSASCAFMLPVATAPNAIVVGSGQVNARDMARAGFGLNGLAAIGISAWVLILLWFERV